ncbi:MAG: helix-turn-helix domain-containing protein [Burkholderiales bacterium]|jgi:putative transcriptional regulator
MTNRSPSSPTPAQIVYWRKGKMGMTQSEAARMVHVTLRAWQWWESGHREMPIGLWELFLIKIDQHPNYKLVE